MNLTQWFTAAVMTLRLRRYPAKQRRLSFLKLTAFQTAFVLCKCVKTLALQMHCAYSCVALLYPPLVLLPGLSLKTANFTHLNRDWIKLKKKDTTAITGGCKQRASIDAFLGIYAAFLLFFFFLKIINSTKLLHWSPRWKIRTWKRLAE